MRFLPTTWQIRKPPVESARGVVVSQHVLASQAGAQVLREGGNAVDAAVTTALAVGVLEPWLSGIGGGGFMLVYEAATKHVHALDFGVVSPRGLDPKRYGLRSGEARGLFGWPAVTGDRNLKGYESICVPGTIDGLGRALERFGTIGWRRALMPASGYAQEGLLVDWYTTLSIATAAAEMAEYPETRARFMPSGHPPVASLGQEGRRLSLAPLGDTLEALAERGYRDFYEGEMASSIVADLRAGGSSITEDDLRAYASEWVEPGTLEFRDARLHVMPGLSGGPSYLQAMSELKRTLPPAPSLAADAYLALARAIRSAYEMRLRGMGASIKDSCTTHVSVIDREGNMVALTNTLLERFGSKVTLPDTGILMNNGVMWFDPQPGRANSIRPAVRPLANMCPVLITKDDEPLAALGAAGGRRIMPALVQLTVFLLHNRMSLDEAMRQPRLDASGDAVVLDENLADEVKRRIAGEYPTFTVKNQVFPAQFAVPSIAQVRGETRLGAAYADAPWPAAAPA